MEQTYEVAWHEFTKSGSIVTKRKEFKTEKALQNFVARLEEKDNFYRILGYRP